MESSRRLNIFSQIIHLFTFLFLAISGILNQSLSLTELTVSAIGILAGLVVSIISEIERLKQIKEI